MLEKNKLPFVFYLLKVTYENKIHEKVSREVARLILILMNKNICFSPGFYGFGSSWLCNTNDLC